MKRSAPDHPKTLALQERLGCSRIIAVGILELLWHWAARFAPRGNVGKWSDGSIAQGIGWDGDAAALVAALVASGWLDENREHRLVIHDWHDHADESVRKSLARAGLTFLSRQRRDAVSTPSRPPEPEPEPEPSQSLAIAKDVSSALKAAPEPAKATSGVVLTFPAAGKQRTWELTQAQIDEWAKLYPALDILAECRRALAWVQAAAARKKTARGMKRYLVGWLNRSTDSRRGGNGAGKQEPPPWPAEDRRPNPSPAWQQEALGKLSSSPGWERLHADRQLEAIRAISKAESPEQANAVVNYIVLPEIIV